MSAVYCTPSLPAAFRLSTTFATANNSEPLIASVEVAVTRPAATLVRVRSAPLEPMLTVLPGAVPAKPPKIVLPTVALSVPTAADVTEAAPRATSFENVAREFEPMATPVADFAVAVSPSAIAPTAPALDALPNATDP